MDGKVNKDNWRQADIDVDSLWLIAERDKSGKHKNIYHGNFVPQIPNRLIRRYTGAGDTVLELFSGSGTTLFECEELRRNYVGFDINAGITAYVRERMKGCTAIDYLLDEIDVTDTEAFGRAMVRWSAGSGKKKVDFMIAHPPYMDVVKFTDDDRDLSRIADLDMFLDRLTAAFANGLEYLKRNGYFAVVAGDVYKNSEVVPLAFRIMDMIKRNFDVKMKGIIVKNIEGNRGKLGVQDIWRYRALRSDYFIFKHEYIFVFKKL